MRSIWKATVSFGLVNIPINLYSATQEHELKFTLLHKPDLSPIRYAKICKEEEREVPYEEIVKGYDDGHGNTIIMSDEDFEKVSVASNKLIEIVGFALAEKIDSIYYEKPYYLEPDKGAGKAYALLREALKSSKKVAIAKYVMKNHEHLAIIKPYEKALVLNQMRLHSELVQPTALTLPDEDQVVKKELEMALQLISQLETPFRPEEYRDTYIEQLKQVIEQKAQGLPVAKRAGKAVKPSKVYDIMNLLKASLDQNAAPAKKKPAKATAKKKASSPPLTRKRAHG